MPARRLPRLLILLLAPWSASGRVGTYSDNIGSVKALRPSVSTLVARLRDVFSLGGKYQDHVIIERLPHHG
jgi:hypothetical protein